MRLLTHPVLSSRLLLIQRTGRPLPPTAGRLVAALISDAHPDHLDFPSNWRA